jgi:dibenzofuran dioxygenase alpha subunit
MTSMKERRTDAPPCANSAADLVFPDTGLVSREVITSEDVYRKELSHIFTKTWLYVGHESQLANPGDYLTTSMGEDSVIVTRAADGNIRVLLNACSHRGLPVCPADAGSTKLFRCAYHGWTYSTSGDLVGVPRIEEAYKGELDKKQYGLMACPRVEAYGGLIFANWDAGAIPLLDYLGEDQRWYLDVMFESVLGKLEPLGPVMKYRARTNWKLPADNAAGDNYHVPYTHGSAFKINFLPDYEDAADYVAYFDRGHGMGDIPKPGRVVNFDRQIAEHLGPEAVEYLDAVKARQKERLSPLQVEMHSPGEGNIFPNLMYLKICVFHALGLLQWQPKGPGETEVRQTLLFDSAAPQSVRDFVRIHFTRENSAAGIFAPDDGENFEQITASSRGSIIRSRDIDYSMGLGHEGEVSEPGYPGHLGPRFSEQNQRNFYRYWRELMMAGEGK